jgi:Holliday junction resolvase RusA-like endonuclease
VSDPESGTYEVISLFVPDIAVAKGRPRFTTTGRPYTPSKTRQSEWRLREHASGQVLRPLEGALGLEIIVMLQPPQMPKKWVGIRLPTKRPDLDNYLKTVLDGLEGIVYKDDAQIVDIHVSKRYAWNSQPGWYIAVRQMDNSSSEDGSPQCG